MLDEEGLYVSAHELTPDRPAYTVETLEHFRREMPEAELHLLIGGDSFADFHHWVRWPEIAAAARLVVLARPGWDLDSIPLDPEVAALSRTDRVLVLRQPAVDVSSTRLREQLAAGLPLAAGTVPDLVVRYVHKYGLYR